MLVEFSGEAKFEKLEKFNKNFCFVITSGNPDFPEKMLMSKDTYQKNKHLLANNTKNLSFVFKGFIKRKNNKFYFYVYGLLEVIIKDLPVDVENELFKNVWEN